MSVTVRKFRTGGWEVDIHIILPNGTRRRDRTRKSCSKFAAHRWGLARERDLLLYGHDGHQIHEPVRSSAASRWEVNAYSRRVLAWRVSNTFDSDFCVEALEDARAN